MKTKPLNRICFFLAICLSFALHTRGQGGYQLVADIGLPLQLEPMADLDVQVKRYWVLDSNLSNNGPGAGCEFNFGTNSSGITIGPKLFYQVDIFMAAIGGKKKTSLYLLFRISGIRYTNSLGSDYRIAPEGGLSLFDMFSFIYGYNFFPPFIKKEKGLSEVFNNRFTFVLTIGGRKRKK